VNTNGEARLVGYAHTRPGEDIEPQHTAPRAVGCTPIFSDHHVRRKAAWLELDIALTALHPGDTRVVCKLIRIGKSFGRHHHHRPAPARHRIPFPCGRARHHRPGR
jgi:hypothetical protein